MRIAATVVTNGQRIKDGGKIMSLWQILTNHRHYWGVPHTEGNESQLIMVCYDCGKVRVVEADIFARK